MTTENAMRPQAADPKPGDSWWGYVQREADGRVNREVHRRVEDDAHHRYDDQLDDQPDERGGLEESWLSDVDPEQLKQAIANLPPDERKVVQLWLDGKTFGEIGQELGISTHRVRSLWKRALARLRKWLQ